MSLICENAPERKQNSAPSIPPPPYPYFDKLQAWLPERLSNKREAAILADCHPDLRLPPLDDDENFWQGREKGLYVDNDYRMKFKGRYYVQRVQLYRPGPRALQMLADCDAQVNACELALDYVFPNREAKMEVYNYLRRHVIKLYHRNQVFSTYKGTVYTALPPVEGKAPVSNMIVIYPDLECRLTGEVDCIHFEWRINNFQAMHAAKLTTPADLITFNHREFWEKRFRLATADRVRLGRALNKKATGSKRRGPRVVTCGSSGQFAYDYDRSLANSAIRYHRYFDKYDDKRTKVDKKTRKVEETFIPADTTQAIVDIVRCTGIPSRDYLRPIDASAFLPAPPEKALLTRAREHAFVYD